MKKMIQIEKKTCKGERTKKKVFRKIFCTKEDSSSSDEDEVNESETKRVIFMEIEKYDKENREEEYEDGQVEYTEELLSVIDVIKGLKKKNKSLQEELKKKKEKTQMMSNLKIQFEEDKRIKEALKEKFEEKDMIIENLEAEIVTLRKDLQQKTHAEQLKQF